MRTEEFISELDWFFIIHITTNSGKQYVSVHKLFPKEINLTDLSDDPSLSMNEYDSRPIFCRSVKKVEKINDCFLVHIDGLKYLYVGSFMQVFVAKSKIVDFKVLNYCCKSFPYVTDDRDNCYNLKELVYMPNVYPEMVSRHCDDAYELFLDKTVGNPYEIIKHIDPTIGVVVGTELCVNI